MTQKHLKGITIISTAILVVSILPILWIGQYLHPFGDDYVFGAKAYQVWTETHSFLPCIKAAWEVSMTMYHTWQGTYSACFLMALQPGIFGQYWLGPIILLFCLIGATYTLLYMVMRKILNIPPTEFLCISTLFVLLTIQFTSSYYDAFFWYNGAMYYTLFYSLSLWLASLLIGYRLTKSKFKKAIICVFSIILTLFIAGGNFVSGLGMGAILFTTIILIRCEQKKCPLFYLLILFIYTIAFSFSVLAPGNAFRQVTVENKPNVIFAAFMAMGKSIEFLIYSNNIIEIFVLALLSPIIFKLASKAQLRFSHPWLCLLITFILYSSFFFAHCYAMGTRGPGRVQNIYSYIHLWLIVINMYYLSGALIKKANAHAPLSSVIMVFIETCKHKYADTLQYKPYFTIALLLLTISIKQSTTNRTISLILKGKAQKFDKEMSEREQTIKASSNNIIILKPLTVKMPSDAFNDITIYPGYWINQGIARYYGKEKVTALPMSYSTESPSMLLARCKRDVGPGNLKFVYFK